MLHVLCNERQQCDNLSQKHSQLNASLSFGFPEKKVFLDDLCYGISQVCERNIFEKSSCPI